MQEYGKFKVGQRVKTTCKYKCKYNTSFEGTLYSIYNKYNRIIFIIIDSYGYSRYIFDLFDEYLEIICQKQTDCKFKVGDLVRNTKEFHRYGRGKIVDIIPTRSSYLIVLDNELMFYEEDLEPDCSKTLNSEQTNVYEIIEGRCKDLCKYIDYRVDDLKRSTASDSDIVKLQSRCKTLEKHINMLYVCGISLCIIMVTAIYLIK